MKILIVKTSALGDLIQSLPVVNDLLQRFPHASIDWAVEETLSGVLRSFPLLHTVIAVPLRQWKKNLFSKSAWKLLLQSIKNLRQEKYDYVFDLQGNCKSGLLTFLSRGKTKVGFSFFSVREWPNIFATTVRFFVPKEMNIQKQYLFIISQVFKESSPLVSSCFFSTTEEERKWADSLIDDPSRLHIMVCPGSQWKNKQLSEEVWVQFLNRIAQEYPAKFFLIWGSFEEREACEKICAGCQKSVVLDRKLSIPVWQYAMHRMDVVIALDSSALHLAGTTKTPTFSIFGPTLSTVFRPLGAQHVSLQGPCPYGRVFIKQCPILRTCPTGACIKNISAETLFQQFTTLRDGEGALL